ncbi:MAG TPA: RagB/SusD family nutrient uptake outer membrane protein [Gemmatimonadaceae bacterium]|nr:RagB/SusD family nutrient uptake outer membrane protein [Gemmatimonadaceae bacterium]
MTIDTAMTAARRALAIAALSMTGACSLDLENPNAPTGTEVITNADGVLSVTVGMQAQFAQTIEDYMVTNSLITDEWGTLAIALVSYISLFTGENFDDSYLVVESPFANSYQVIRSANTVLAGADQVPLGAATTAGVRATAKLFKAMALGFLIQQYEAVPVDVIEGGGVPAQRDEVLDTVLVLLERARADIETVTDADLTSFASRALAAGFDLRNTINAMLARYYLMDGQYDAAITAADRVNLAVLSVLEYPAPTRNPIENLAFQLRYVGGLQSFANAAEPGDRRPAYWLDLAASPLAANPPDSVIKPLLRYSQPNDPFPVYLPDEMKLIKAEAYARLGQFAPAATLVNEVRTQSSSPVAEPVAGLPSLPATALDTEAELLAQIAYERRYELYMQGLRWEDTRRFGPTLTTVPTFDFLPLPNTECTTNPGAGC